MAQSLDQVVLFRILQGMFGAGLIPLSQVVLMDIYPPDQRGKAMGIWTMGVMLGPIIGPSLGRLSDRALQLAFGVLRQRALRRGGRLRHAVLPCRRAPIAAR